MAQLIKIITILIFSFLLTVKGYAQELSCFVEVNSRQIDGSERVIFDEMERAIFDLINGRKWTDDEFEIEERIDCSILITLTERVSANEFKGNIQVQAFRPIYNSSYRSPLMNVRDEDFTIRYNQFEPIIYNKTSYSGELASILGYYIYMILAYDYDSFSPEGGTRFFQKAQQIVNFAQASSESGWKAFEDQSNRYWLVENALSARFKPMRKLYYDYHRRGFDVMKNNVTLGRRQVTQSLKSLKKIHEVAPSSYNMQVLFNAKAQELLDLYKEATPQEKNEISELLITIDPGNSNKYDKLRK